MAAQVLATRRAVALRTADSATGAPARLAAEPLARGQTLRPAATALHACLAGEPGSGADRPDPDARIARPAAATDAAGDGAERDVGTGQEEPRPERARAEQLEELTARRALGELPCDDAGEIHLRRQAPDPGLVLRHARAGLVARVPTRLARHGEVGEAVAGGVLTTGRTVALRAAEATTGARAARQAAEPFAPCVAAVGATAAYGAGLALVLPAGHVVATAGRREAGVARAAAAADTARDRAERDVGAREEEAGAERAGSEQLEELAAGRSPGQLPGSVRCDVHVTRR